LNNKVKEEEIGSTCSKHGEEEETEEEECIKDFGRKTRRKEDTGQT
jgi:hypothetical protein